MRESSRESYAEFGNTLFRGRLTACHGEVDFKLGAGAINAVDTIHIADGSVSYSQFFQFHRSVSNGGDLIAINAVIQDEQAFLEVSCRSNRLNRVYVNNGEQNRHNAVTNKAPYPVIVVVPLTKGTYPVRLTANSSGTAEGWLRLRYIRQTG